MELWAHAVFWRKVRELSRMMVSIGFLKDEEDLYHLNRFELDQALAEAIWAWAIGVPARGVAYWQAKSKSAKASWTPYVRPRSPRPMASRRPR
jgi:pyruvate,water dikinase